MGHDNRPAESGPMRQKTSSEPTPQSLERAGLEREVRIEDGGDHRQNFRIVLNPHNRQARRRTAAVASRMRRDSIHVPANPSRRAGVGSMATGSGARVAEEAALEMPYAGNCIEGSNPSRSVLIYIRSFDQQIKRGSFDHDEYKHLFIVSWRAKDSRLH